MEAYIKQKRASPGMIQASDLQITRPMSGARGGRDLAPTHAYDGPLHFMTHSANPDEILPAKTTPTSPSEGNTITGSMNTLLLGRANFSMNYSRSLRLG